MADPIVALNTLSEAVSRYANQFPRARLNRKWDAELVAWAKHEATLIGEAFSPAEALASASEGWAGGSNSPTVTLPVDLVLGLCFKSFLDGKTRRDTPKD